jgi:nucleoside-diphosphate-sugar epimerase
LSKAIGIIGCGWLGLPLARALLEKDHLVYGSTTSEEKLADLKKEGIIPSKIVLGENKIQGPVRAFLTPLEILIINVPPKLRGKYKENYVQKMKLLYDEIMISGIKKIVFISSTAVYGNVVGEVTEKTETLPVSTSGRQLLAVEQLFGGAENIATAIIRFGGLIGPNRHPVKFLAGREGLENGEDYVNLIHLNDCIGMILFILENDYWNATYNGVFPDHPIKSEFYTAEALKRGLPAPKYVLKKSKNKRKFIISKNILNKFYCFSTPITD